MTPKPTQSILPGTRLGPYEIQSQLGSGGMGEVWKALDTRLGRVVAIKVSKAGFSERFEREARAVAALNHPNIAALYDVGPNYFVMEYVDGKPLQLLIPRQGLPVAQAIAYATQIAGALTAAHAAGIVHRDLKPGNIMVAADGRVKVVDFGLARLISPATAAPGDATFTQSAEGTIAGTVSYMSPEQAQGRAVDGRSDIFSFGSVLYEMIVGSRAFHGDSPMSTLANIINGEPRPIAELVPHLPRELETLLTRCLRKDPSRRWQNMADVNVVLLDLKEDSDSGKLSATPQSASPKRPGKPFWIASAAVLILISAAAVWYLVPARKPSGTAAAVPLTSYPGDQSFPAFSPDGNQIAFTWNGPKRENSDIYVKVVGEGDPLRLTTDPAEDTAPAWSPDGRWIAFIRSIPGGRYAVLMISPLGGPERKLGEFESLHADAHSLAWSPDSKRIFLSAAADARHSTGLFILTVDTGDLKQLTSLDARAPGDAFPALSPDGTTLAFLRLRDRVVGDLFLLKLAADFSPKGDPALLVSSVESRATWTASGKELIYSSGPALSTSLNRISASGVGLPQRVAAAGDAVYGVAISHPAGAAPSRLAWSHRFQDANIYRVELSGPSGSLGVPQSVIASSMRDVFPQYSPDGKSIAFYSNRGGALEIWVCQADGSRCRQVTNMGARTTGTPRWSPDGRQISFDSNKEGRYECYVINAEGGTPKRMTDPPNTNFGANWSPDGRWLYFTSDRSGSPNIWRLPAAGGPPEQITHHDGNGANLSADGAFLYFVKDMNTNDSSLWRVPLKDGLPAGEELQLVPRIYRFGYAVTTRGIYYGVQQASTSPSTINLLDLSTRKSSVITQTDKLLDIGVSVSPDGRYLLYAQTDYLGSNLMMIDNFR